MLQCATQSVLNFGQNNLIHKNIHKKTDIHNSLSILLVILDMEVARPVRCAPWRAIGSNCVWCVEREEKERRVHEKEAKNKCSAPSENGDDGSERRDWKKRQ